jgi:twitching motility two-component system response regulator PilH
VPALRLVPGASNVIQQKGFAMKKVLVVDDAAVDLKNLEQIVSGTGALVVTASSGNEALLKAREHQPSLILLDVNMPGLDGFSTARQLAGDALTKAIPVVFVTSKNQKADRVFAQMLGAKGYVTKPYRVEDILPHL